LKTLDFPHFPSYLIITYRHTQGHSFTRKVVANWWRKQGGRIMAEQWVTTEIKGLRYRIHPTRKRKKGIRWEHDVFYQYRRTFNGRRFEEGLGWLFEGMDLAKATAKVHELNENAKLGKGPATLAEAQKLADAERRAAEELVAEEARTKITFDDIWQNDQLLEKLLDGGGVSYLTQARADRGDKALEREVSIYSLWIKPIIGPQPLTKVADWHLEKIKSNMLKAGRAPRSIQYCFAVIRQVFNFAISRKLFTGTNPAKRKEKSGVKLPTIENKRLRYLTREEADELLEALREVSTETHDHALLSLQTGMRAGEVWKLRWADVDMESGILTLLDTKNGKTRPAYMTGPVRAMLRKRRPANPDPAALVFPSRTGERIGQVSSTFDRTVEKLGLNAGITDRRQKVTFHSLRHTFASWHVQSGTHLPVLRDLMGHSTIQLTERYAHLGENASQAATNNFDRILNTGTAKVLKMAATG
jgi:integrase